MVVNENIYKDIVIVLFIHNTKMSSKQNKLKSYTNRYYTEQYKDTYNTYKNGDEPSNQTRIYDNEINNTIYFGLNKISSDWKLSLYIFNGLTEQTNMKSLIDWSNVYYDNETNTFYNYTKLFDIVKEDNEDYSVFDILMEVREQINTGKYVEINNKSYGNVYSNTDCKDYEAFLMKLCEMKTEMSIDFNGLSWGKLYNEMDNDKLLNIMLKEEPNKNGKMIMKYNYMKHKDFNVFKM